MKSTGIVLLCLTGVLFLSCPETPEDEVNPYRQEQIPWPSLADSPWPMYHHDPQSTGRSQFIGPREGEIFWIREFEPFLNLQAITSLSLGMKSRVYFGSSNDDSSHNDWRLYCLNPDSTVYWTFIDQYSGISHSEIEAGPILTSSGLVIFPTIDGQVLALDTSGVLQWSYMDPGGDEILSEAMTIDQHGNLYYIDGSGNLSSIDPDGDLLWELAAGSDFKAHNDNQIAISPGGDVLYVTGAVGYATLYAVNTSGTILWSWSAGAWASSSPMVDNDGNIYLATIYNLGENSPPNGIYSVTPEGDIRWTQPGYRANSSGAIGPEGDIYYAVTGGTYHDNLVAFDNEGNLKWERELYDICDAPLVCDREGMIFLITGNLFQGFMPSGELSFEVELDNTSSIVCPAISESGWIIIGTFADPKMVCAIK